MNFSGTFCVCGTPKGWLDKSERRIEIIKKARTGKNLIQWQIYDRIFILRILYATKFIRQFKKLPEAVRCIADEKGMMFKNNPFDQRLRTHKLSGKLDGLYAFWVNYKIRVIF